MKKLSVITAAAGFLLTATAALAGQTPEDPTEPFAICMADRWLELGDTFQESAAKGQNMITSAAAFYCAAQAGGLPVEEMPMEEIKTRGAEIIMQVDWNRFYPIYLGRAMPSLFGPVS